MPDPRAPVIPLATEVDTDNYVVNSAGQIRHDYKVHLTEHDMGRIRAGYVCAKCLEVQDKPFPKQCWVCKFPMADRQAEFVAKGYRGATRLGPQTDADTELAVMAEFAERQKSEQRDKILRPSQILLPGKDF